MDFRKNKKDNGLGYCLFCEELYFVNKNEALGLHF